MTDTAIGRVEALALHDNQPLVQERGLVVEWRPDMPIDDDAYDLDYAPPSDAPVDVFPAAQFDPLDADELADLQDDAAQHGILMDPPPDLMVAPGALADAEHWYFDNEQPPNRRVQR